MVFKTIWHCGARLIARAMVSLVDVAICYVIQYPPVMDMSKHISVYVIRYHGSTPKSHAWRSEKIARAMVININCNIWLELRHTIPTERRMN